MFYRSFFIFEELIKLLFYSTHLNLRDLCLNPKHWTHYDQLTSDLSEFDCKLIFKKKMKTKQKMLLYKLECFVWISTTEKNHIP